MPVATPVTFAGVPTLPVAAALAPTSIAAPAVSAAAFPGAAAPAPAAKAASVAAPAASAVAELPKDPQALDAVFEGVKVRSVARQGQDWIVNGKKAPVLGQGWWKVALEHPDDPSLVVKLHVSRWGFPVSINHVRVEKEASALAAEADVSPQVVGWGKIDIDAKKLETFVSDWMRLRVAEAHKLALGKSVELRYSVEERIFGKRLPSVMDQGMVSRTWRFFRRMIDNELVFWDFHRGNIFYGKTAKDAEPRLFIVDAGALRRATGLPREQLVGDYRDILSTYTNDYVPEYGE